MSYNVALQSGILQNSIEVYAIENWFNTMEVVYLDLHKHSKEEYFAYFNSKLQFHTHKKEITYTG